MNSHTKIPNGSNSQLKVLAAVTCIAGLSMGNQSCQTTPTTAARYLKMDVAVGTLDAKTVTLPDGEVVDFKYVANSLFYQEVMKNDHFVISNPISTISTSNVARASTSSLAATAESDAVLKSVISDTAILRQYGFIKSDSSSVSTSGLHTASKLNGVQAQDNTSIATVNDPNACLYDIPQASLAGEVNSFALTGGGGVSVGYTSGGTSSTTTTGIGGTIQYSAATLNMGFRTDDPLTQLVMEGTEGTAIQSKISASVAFPAGGVPLGLNFFYNTPIANAISSAMAKGLTSLVAKYSTDSAVGSWNDAWESRVVFDPQIADQDTTVAIRGGTRAGIKAGDMFTVTNMHYRWTGETCNSLLNSKIPMSPTPIAVIKVITPGDNVSVAQVVSYSGDTKIESGAQVKISSLYVAPTASPTPVSK